jgi:hypothetical protein
LEQPVVEEEVLHQEEVHSLRLRMMIFLLLLHIKSENYIL